MASFEDKCLRLNLVDDLGNIRGFACVDKDPSIDRSKLRLELPVPAPLGSATSTSMSTETLNNTDLYLSESESDEEPTRSTKRSPSSELEANKPMKIPRTAAVNANQSPRSSNQAEASMDPPAASSTPASTSSRIEGSRKRISSEDREIDFVKKSFTEKYEQKRNAKEVLTEAEYAMFSKPFSKGWKRVCTIGEERGIVAVYYSSPTGLRCSSYHQVRKIFESGSKDGLSLDDFNFKHEFIGFPRESELLKLPSYLTDVLTDDKKREDPPSFGKFVLINKTKKAVQCIHPQCRRHSHTLPNPTALSKHISVSHTESASCKLCSDREKVRVRSKKARSDKPVDSLHIGAKKSRLVMKSHSKSSKNVHSEEKVKNSGIILQKSEGRNIVNNNIEIKQEKVDERDHEESKISFKALITKKDGFNNRTVKMKVRKSCKIKKVLLRIQREEGYDHDDGIWVCEKKIVDDEFKGESVDGKVARFQMFK